MNLNSIIEEVNMIIVDIVNDEKRDNSLLSLSILLSNLKDKQEEINKFKIFNTEITFEEIRPNQ